MMFWLARSWSGESYTAARLLYVRHGGVQKRKGSGTSHFRLLFFFFPPFSHSRIIAAVVAGLGSSSALNGVEVDRPPAGKCTSHRIASDGWMGWDWMGRARK